ncbi:galectin-3 [Rhinophrynus dorsalis]
MADFSLDDALSGQSSANNQQSQGQGTQSPWGNQNPPAGQPYQGYPGAPPGQQYPSFPGQPYPGFPGPAPGQQYPAPGFPGPVPGQQYPGYPGATPQYPGPGPQYPGYPGPTDGKQATPTAPVELKVPHELPLMSGVVPRLMLTIQGKVNNNPKRFAIDFKRGHDIALHINPRFDERPRVIVRNSMIGGKWGPEERPAPKFPFEPGHPFKIQIMCEQDQFKVAANNENLFSYKYRVRELNDIRSVCISGDITLSEANVAMV